MSLKILPFNKALLKKDWKMTKWLCFMVAGLLFFTMTLGVISTHNNFQRTLQEVGEHPEHYRNFDEVGYKDSIRDALQLGFRRLTGVEPLIILFIPMVVAALLFGEEKRRKTLEVLFTMPFTRWEIFFNKTVVALGNVFLPILINAAIMIIALGLSQGLRDFYSPALVMYWLVSDIFRLFVMLAFSLLFAVLTGNSISQIVLTVIFFIFPFGFAGLIGINMSIWGYGYTVIDRFLEIFGNYTIPAILTDLRYVPIAYHLISAIVMFVASKLLFDKNKLERSGETLEFEAIETFFKAGVAVCTALLSGGMFTWFVGRGISGNMFTVLGYIVGLFGGWSIASFIIKSQGAKV